MSQHHLYVRRASAGSGKTFTLAAHYIALLLHGDSYRSILAVTFTNKATAEMKERIIGYLYAIARHTDHKDTQGFLARVRDIYKELGFQSPDISDDNYCARRAEKVFTDIMADYDSMRVQTIDAFLQSLLSGMVQMLGGTVGYTVELDVKTIISEAVDRLLTVGAHDSDLLTHIENYIDKQMEDEKSWDIRKGLNDIGMELYKEYLQQEEQRLVFDPDQLKQLDNLKKWRETDKAKAALTHLSKLLDRAQRFTAADFNRGQQSYLPPLDRLRACLVAYDEKVKDTPEDDSKTFMVGFSDTTLRKINDPALFAKEYKGKEPIESIRQELLSIIAAAAECRSLYLYPRYVLRYVNDMVLMGALRDEINRALDANNSRLLATTANTLYRALQPGDADFILEKAGIRYRHIMLDEFQDTSTLQWANFSRLLQELLSTIEGSTLIVGDIKQSIYRWRNGDWSIMAGLEENWADYYNTDIEPLTRNFRSEREIVRFNLDTFLYLSEAEKDNEIAKIYEEGYGIGNLSEYYRAGHEGGYVQLHAYTQTGDKRQAELRQQVRENILRDMFNTIEELLAADIPAQKMMILIRYRNEAKEILNILEQLRTDDKYPNLQHVALISNDCFQLRFSRTVMLLVSAIRYVYTDDGAALAYVQHYCPNTTLRTRKWAYHNMALTDMIEDVLQRDVLTLPDYHFDDLAYLNCFRDLLLAYVTNNGSDGKAFIRYWDEKMCEKCIPSMGEDGIRIMTVHTSKGLQAENVFIPFCNWSMESDRRGDKLWCRVPELKTSNGEDALLPIPQDATAAETAFNSYYAAEHHLQRIDNLNLLYVAFTRAAERLYIYTDVTEIKNTTERKNLHVGQLMAERCELWSELTSLFAAKRIGNPEDYCEKAYGESLEDAIKNYSLEDAAEPLQFRGEEKVMEPFSFEQAETEVAECHSSSTRMEFRQSQDSVKYGWDIAAHIDEEPSIDRRAFGTICHDVLATIGTYTTIEEAQKAVQMAVDRAYDQGHIPSETLRDEVLTLLTDTVTDPQTAPWFTGDWRVQREEAILLVNEENEIEERRMDRVMWHDDKAIVLDYKFGHDDPKYDLQVRHYMQICRDMGAREVEGYLWIAAERRLERV